ncbi:MAG: tRNA lysidine(34) synthetase TilS [Bacteroidota bacterium]
MNLQQRFKEHITQNLLLEKNSLLIIAISGGVDSMVLAELCKNNGYSIVLAHCNFQLRDAESTRDQTFVESYATQHQLQIFIEAFETKKYVSKHSIGIQEAARSLRYAWLHQLAEKLFLETGLPTYILTAHHADDQIETLMMHFFRGTGLKGLTGIPERNGRIIRPLLNYAKKELLDYAKEHKIAFVEDSSNLSSDYTRNFFRNEIIPALEKVYPSVKNNLLDNIRRFKSTELLYREAITPMLKRMMLQRGEEYHVPIQTLLKNKNNSLIYALIHPFGFTEGQIEELIKLANAMSGSFMEAPVTRYRIIKHRNHFVIAPPVHSDSAIILIEESQHSVTYASGIITLKIQSDKPFAISSDRDVALLDAKDIQFPLVVRKWKEGDYFYPLGMRKKKKIARFLIDQKLSKTEKEKIWVIESNQRIIWVIGQRIDDRFKITDTSNKVLKIENRIHDLSDKMS